MRYAPARRLLTIVSSYLENVRISSNQRLCRPLQELKIRHVADIQTLVNQCLHSHIGAIQ